MAAVFGMHVAAVRGDFIGCVVVIGRFEFLQSLFVVYEEGVRGL